MDSTEESMYVLGIETSCDETAAAIVDDQRKIHAHVVASQVKDHAAFGGVVPDIAARSHLEKIAPLVQSVLEEAPVPVQRLSAIAVTAGPGLSGSLWVGLSFAKALALAWQRPLVRVNHLEGHALTARLTHDVAFPYLVLIASGGHSEMCLARGVGNYLVLGHSLDDAAGEVFDKVSRMLGFSYPGGKALEACAKNGDPQRFAFPRPLKGQPGCHFSFAGLKTAAYTLFKRLPDMSDQIRADFCASFQQAIADVCVSRYKNAFEAVHNVSPTAFVLSGGVAANQTIRKAIEDFATSCNIPFVVPPVELCTDNGAMIAWAGLEQFRCGCRNNLREAPDPHWELKDLLTPS
ncbi:MAG: tRNA (adenosine(37)-N6)-threonylcarbamoyltransferase complex transferase subunit TsaD [Holosporales bacterium]|jgi:N6-L-threonylcarbamoyladenine synthase|nr:tRNA (adenosine(37)-N6)-threonylcarbamoyltransferase complex transferase subunit TsaD [Holosporales bacterium]